METRSIQTGGIVVAIVFAVATFVGIAAISFASAKQAKLQKSSAVKAEAKALLRKQTVLERAR